MELSALRQNLEKAEADKTRVRLPTTARLVAVPTLEPTEYIISGKNVFLKFLQAPLVLVMC